MDARNKPRIIAGALSIVFFLAVGAAAQIPEGIDYQGYLTDASGQALDQPVNVQFAIYAVESGGSPLWTETLALVPEQGQFSVTLGAGASPFPVGLFSTPVWIGVTVGTDSEMTPRRPLTSVAYSKRAVDSDTVGGLPAGALDQSGAVAGLQSSLALTDAAVTTLGSSVAANGSAISGVQVQADGNSSDISQLQSDLGGTQSDVNAIEATLPTLQSRVSGSCVGGSSIRQIFANGTVTCETDDAGLWGLFNDNLYYLSGSIGIGTTAPAAAIQIDAPLGTDPFRARVQSSTKLRVHGNGSVSVGTSSAGPDDGLYVLGDALIGPGSSAARMTVTDSLWQAALDNADAGGDDWYLGSSATGWAAGGGKFIISPTDSSSNAALVIDSNKDIGIGTTNPLTRLHLGGGSDVTPAGGGYLTVGGITGANIAIDSNEIMARSNGAAATLALNAEGGEVRINSGGSRDSDALEIRGRVYFDNGGNSGMRMTATNSNPTNAVLNPTQYEEALIGESAFPFWRVYSREFYAETPLQYKTYSDRSLKQNVRPIPDALATVMALEGVTYELDKHPMDTRDRQLSQKQEFDRQNQLGFIAQDVAKVLPQLVSEDESTGLQSVGYMGAIPILVEAIKAQQKQIEAQQRQIEELRALIN